ncbi:Crp/Fnr family transcriptional regulator, partial [Desulfobacterales bacterium HSG17]|nr:Crp/Fnr family transcriptional regulator [Desulfobacterales bacterium HSG17]
LMNNEKRSASVEALEETEVAVLNREILSQNLKKMPPYMEKIILSVSNRLREANNRIHPNLNKDCTYLVLKQIRLLYSDPAREKGYLPLKAAVKEIAEDLGLSKKRIIKALSSAVKVGLIICKNNKIMIPDMDELIDFTELTRICA